MFGFEEYYIGLIEEAKSPEEIKKILAYNFVQGKGVPQEVLDAVFDIDPTKKKSYTRWVLMQWDGYKQHIMDALKNGRLKKMFQTFKERAGSGLDLTNIENFDKAMEYIPDVDPILEKEGDPDAPENDFDILFNSPEWVVAVPHTYEANRKLGVGCRWCTAGAFGDNDYYWNRYSPAGPIFVNFDKRHSEVAPRDGKEYPYTRYQFLFEWQNWAGELMDSDDTRVDFDDVDMPQDVVEFYGEQNPKYKDMIENGAGDPQERWENYNEDRWNHTIVILNINDTRYLSLLPEQNEEMDLDVDYMLYDEEDTSDPIVGSYFDKDNCLIAKSSDETAALLKDTRDEFVYVFADTSSRYVDFDIRRLDAVFDSTHIIFGVERYYLFLMPKKSAIDDSDWSPCSIDMDDYFNNSSVDRIFLNPMITDIANKNGIEGYYGYAFEVVFDDGSHALCLYDGGNIIPMIRNDIPEDGHFSAYVQDGKVVINGRFTYKFGIGGEADESNLSMSENLGEYNGEEYYIVQTGKDGVFYNVYNAAKKECIFKENCFSITPFYRFAEFLKCSWSDPEQDGTTGRKEGIYSLEERRFLIPPCERVASVFQDGAEYAGRFWQAFEEGKPIVIYDAAKNFAKIANVSSTTNAMLSSEKKPYVIVKMVEGGYNVLSLEDGKFTIDEPDLIKYGQMPANYGGRSQANIIMFQKEEQGRTDVCNVYNFVTGKLVFPNYRVREGAPKQIVYSGRNIYKVTNSDKKCNLIDNDGNIILPKNVDHVLPATETNPILIPIIDGNRLWLMDTNETLYPTKEGIDLDVFQFDGTEYSKLPKFKYKGYEFKIKPENGKFELYCVPPQGQGYNQEIENEIRSLLFKQQAAIRESFNRVFNMINNFYDKDEDA